MLVVIFTIEGFLQQTKIDNDKIETYASHIKQIIPHFLLTEDNFLAIPFEIWKGIASELHATAIVNAAKIRKDAKSKSFI